MSVNKIVELPRSVETIKTPNLALRELQPGDAAAIAHYMNDPAAQWHFESMELPYDEEHAHGFIHSTHIDAEQGKGYTWGVQRRFNLIGHGSLHSISQEHQSARIAVTIRPQNRRRGYATETVDALLDYGFERLGLNRIETHVYRENRGSHRLVLTTGFTPEGTLREKEQIRGEYRDVVPYSILKREWQQMRNLEQRINGP